MIADIHRVFGDVVKGRGYSWSECAALDNGQDDDACFRAGLRDTDAHWSDLVDDESWEPFPGVGGFSFINHEGFRYYLPAAMIRMINGNATDIEWSGSLLREVNRFCDEALGFWTAQQLACIARFVRHMSVHQVDEEGRAEWASGLAARWHRHLS